MIKQSLLLLLVVGAVFCQEDGATTGETRQLLDGEGADGHQLQQQQQQPQQEQKGNKLNGLGNHLLDVALIAERNTKRAIEEAKPTLSAIKSNLKERLSAVKNNPQVKKYAEGIISNPRTQQLRESAEKLGKNLVSEKQRILEQGQQKLNGFVEQVNSRRRTLDEKLRAEHEQRNPEAQNEESQKSAANEPSEV